MNVEKIDWQVYKPNGITMGHRTESRFDPVEKRFKSVTVYYQYDRSLPEAQQKVTEITHEEYYTREAVAA